MCFYKHYFMFLWAILIMMPQAIHGQSNSDSPYQYDDTEYVNSPSLLQRIEGIWISDIYCTTNFSGLPFYILDIHNGNAKLDMIGYGYAETLASNSPSDIPKGERTIAQRIEDNNFSLYIAWSNERLKVPNQAFVSALGQAGGDVAYEITKQGTSNLLGSSFMGELGSEIISGIASNIISSMIFDAFSPSKKINVLEMNIQQENEYELTAHAVIQEIKIKGEEKPINAKTEQDIHFTKYDPASGVFFDIPFKQEIYVPGDGFLKEIPEKYQEIGMSYLKYYDLKVPTHISQENMASNYQTLPSYHSYVNPFNVFQIKKLQYYNEQRVLNLGYEHPISKAYLGVQMQIKEDKKGKKGCCVYQVSHSSPAYLFDIQEGDYLLSIDGFEIDTPEQAEKLIESLKPFEWITIRLKRGKKTINVDVELSKQ